MNWPLKKIKYLFYYLLSILNLRLHFIFSIQHEEFWVVCRKFRVIIFSFHVFLIQRIHEGEIFWKSWGMSYEITEEDIRS